MTHGSSPTPTMHDIPSTSASAATRQRYPQRDQMWNLVLAYSPWILLLIATVVHLLWPGQGGTPSSWQRTVVVLALVLLSAAWVYLGHSRRALRAIARTRDQDPSASACDDEAQRVDGSRLRTGLYFIGLLVLCAVLMMFDEVFLVFAIAGFFHAHLLRPWPLAFVGVLGTSLVINGITMHIWAPESAQAIMVFTLVVAVQTAAISAGILLSARAERQERRQEELVTKLDEALRENAELHQQLLAHARHAGVHDERRRLAREIHDTLAQGLAGIITQLQAAGQVAQDPPMAQQHTDQALHLARASLVEARRSLHALAPRELGTAQLPEALETLTGRWSEDSGVALDLHVTGESVPLSPALEVVLFRVAQEALTNVAKHAQASRVGVTLSYTETEILLDVRDDGRGFTGRRSDGFGLTSMQQRVRGVGGRVNVEGGPGEGTSVSASVPSIGPGETEESPESVGRDQDDLEAMSAPLAREHVGAGAPA